MNTDQINVLMISKALVVGAYHKKLEEIVSLGIRLDVVIPQEWGGRRAERLQGDGYSIHSLPTVFSGKNHFHFYPSVSDIIKEVKPDIVHIDEESFSLVTFLIMRQARALGIPALFFNWQNIYKTFPLPFSSMERYTIKNAVAAIAGSREIKDILIRKGCSTPIYIIPQFGVDTKVFYHQPQLELRRRITTNPDSFIVGYVGRFIQEKGIDDLLQACKLLPDKIKIVLIGAGDQRLTLERHAKEYNIIERVYFIDHVKSTEIPQYLNILDCLVLPSHTRPNWKEQFGRILIEAMACEVPVIGSDSGEIPNVIGDAGIVYPETNIDALRKAIEKLFTDKVLRIKLGQEGRMRVEKYFTQRKIAEDTVEVYRRILAK